MGLGNQSLLLLLLFCCCCCCFVCLFGGGGGGGGGADVVEIKVLKRSGVQMFKTHLKESIKSKV